MKHRMTITGIDALQRKLDRMATEIPRAMESIVKIQATTLCGEYARATGPGKTLSEAPVLKYQKKVAGQIRQLFPASDRPYSVAAIIGRRSEKLAKGYLRAIAQQKPAQARRYLREAGIQVEVIDKAAHQAARTADGSGVPRSAEPIAVVNSARLRPYIREAQAKVGMAKASWYQAAMGIAKRIRTQASLADGSRRTFQKFPASIRKVARKFAGLGGSTVAGSGFHTTVTIFSNVNHGPEALDQANFALANATASKTMKKAVENIIAHLHRKLFG